MSVRDTDPVNTPNEDLQAKLEGTGSEAPAPAPAETVTATVPEQTAPPTATLPPADPPTEDPAAPEGVGLPEPAEPKPEVKWEATGNDTLDSLGDLFVANGVSGDQALAEYTSTGEISQETYDDLVAGLGEPTAKLVYNQFRVAMGELKAAAEQDAQKIYEAVGGQEVWKTVAEWTKRLDEQTRNEYNQLLKSGGRAAQLAASDLKAKMMSDPQFKARAELLGTKGETNGQPPAQTMYDRASYSKAIREAERRGSPQEIQQIREAGKAAMKSNPNWKIGNK